ncbi:MAG: cytidylate kinase family protein [Magnetococcales bacterium]|nr:cytidylate kinase family protein [Magnetococcales bacterium]
MEMERDTQEILQSFLKVERYAVAHQKRTRADIPPMVTVSRFCGANGGKISRMLADRLGVACYDQKLVETITKEIKADKYLVSRLDEHVTSWVDDLVYDVFSGKGSDKEYFIRGMIRACSVPTAHIQ